MLNTWKKWRRLSLFQVSVAAHTHPPPPPSSPSLPLLISFEIFAFYLKCCPSNMCIIPVLWLSVDLCPSGVEINAVVSFLGVVFLNNLQIVFRVATSRLQLLPATGSDTLTPLSLLLLFLFLFLHFWNVLHLLLGVEHYQLTSGLTLLKGWPVKVCT